MLIPKEVEAVFGKLLSSACPAAEATCLFHFRELIPVGGIRRGQHPALHCLGPLDPFRKVEQTSPAETPVDFIHRHR